MIALEHLSIQFGGKYCFRDVTLTIRVGDRVGLIGPNGAGKSTMMKIIAGFQTPEEGEVQMPREYKLGYLPQEPTLEEGALERSILAEALRSKEDLLAYTEELEEIQDKLISSSDDHESPAYHELLDRFGELQHKFEDAGGFTIEAEASRVLAGLGFTEKDFTRPLKEFSGGWQMRVLLAKLLIKRPDALLLDEPTNHLDLESMMWLEDFLYGYEGSLLLISHDRKFLNDVTGRTAEISPGGKVEVFPGNYDYYETAKAEREALLEAQSATLANRRKELESFVDRFRYKASKAKQAQSRIKMLARMERVELASKAPSVHFAFPAAQASGRTVFEIEGAAKSYDGITDVFSNCDLFVERGERIAFLGKNGEGKTTLGKILAGVEPFTKGKLKTGHNVTIGYYAQHQADSLNPKLTVLETVDSLARAMFFSSNEKINYSEGQLRTLLGAFLFSGDDVFKQVRVLSGGEKSRLALAKMLLEPCNTLILDEPTNHLDMRSKEVLKQALMAFDGTVIVISHDRDFLEDLVERIITFGSGVVKDYMGSLEQYLEALHESELARIKGKQVFKKDDVKLTKAEKKEQYDQSAKDRKRQQAELRNEKSHKEKPLKNKMKKIEDEMASIEKKKEEIEHAMFEPDYYKDSARVAGDAKKLSEFKKKLEELYYSWSQVSEELEKV
ncbi:MAG: ABC-F family ATP-binding cassette domain-containing protein [Candidatus Kapaibacterium sp.]